MDLTFPQYLAVLALLDSPSQTVGTLGTRLDTGAETVTPLIRRLETAGMATRARDPDDDRRILVDPTARARELEPEIRGVSDRIRAACHLTTAGTEELRQTLQDLAHPLDD